MMSFRSIVAVAAAVVATNAHMIMTSPVPYSVDKIDNSPISKSQFPCKSQNGFAVSSMNSMAVGAQQTLSFSGSAVHGGGSCQLSVTMDTEPTANSVFKVIKSIEGGCPGVEGKKDYTFSLPDSIPNGKATFAWTWFSKLAGQAELYMNCAPIEVTGGASDRAAFDALPNMLVANIDDTCKSVPNSAVKFPNPGQSLEDGGTGDAKAPVGSGCGSSGAAPAPPSYPSGGSAPVPSSAASPIASTAPTAPAAPLPSTKTTLLIVTATPSPIQSAAPTPAPGTATPAQPTTPATGGNSTGGASGSGSGCSEEGTIMCNGPKKFGLCNNGQVVWQDVAPGTTCTSGVVGKKRSYRGRVTRRKVHGSMRK